MARRTLLLKIFRKRTAVRGRRIRQTPAAKEWIGVITGVAALSVAFVGWRTAVEQTKAAKEQTILARKSLDFAIKQSNANGLETQRALAATEKVAEATSIQTDLLRRSLGISQAQQSVTENMLQLERSASVDIVPEGVRDYEKVLSSPTTLFSVKNTSDNPIERARIEGVVTYVPQDDLYRLTRNNPPLVYAINKFIAAHGEAPAAFQSSFPLLPEIALGLRTGQFVLLTYVRVRWRNSGAKRDSVQAACFFYYGPPEKVQRHLCRTEFEPM